MADAHEGGASTNTRPTPTRAPLLEVLAWERLELCRTPAADGPPWERAIAGANHRAAERSRRELRATLPGWDAVFDAGWAADPIVVDLPESFTLDLGLVGLFDELMVDHHLAPERLGLVVDGKREDPTARLGVQRPGYGITRVDPRAVAVAVADGAVVTVAGVDEHRPRLNRWMEHIDRLVGQTARADLTWIGAGPGTVIDGDDAGRLVILVDGEGRVEVRPAVHGPRPSRTVLPSSHVLSARTAIYVPPGRPHRLLTGTGAATVATIVVPRLSIREILQAAGDDAVFWPLLRADVPVDPTEEVGSYAGSVFDRSSGLAEALTMALDGPTIDRTMARNRGRMGARWSAGFVSSVRRLTERGDDGISIRLPIPGGIQVGPDSGGEAVIICAGGIKARTTPAVVEAMGVLADAASHDLSEVSPFGPVDDPTWARRLLDELLATPLAELASPA